MPTRSNSIKVSRIARRRHRKHFSLIKKKRSNNVVHVIIHSTQNIPSISNKFLQQISLSKYREKHASSVTQYSNDRPVNTTNLSVSQNAWDYGDLEINSSDTTIRRQELLIQQNQTDTIQDHHRKKKKKTGNNRIQLWTKGATSGSIIAGINGMLNISLYGPSGIVTDSSSGTLFVADTYNHRVISYAAGTVVAGGNGPGNSTTTLDFPYGLVYESVTKSLIIPNYSTNNIVRWVLGATNRAYVAGDVMGNPGSNSTFLNSPVGMTMDPMGNIYVADSGNNRIQFFMAGQSTATTIAGTSASGTNATQLNIPFWVILDNQLNLYVSDTFNNRVQKFLRY